MRRWLAIALCILGAAPAFAQGTNDNTPVTGPLSGYMDFHFNKADGEPGVIDFHRFVLFLGHEFDARTRLFAEVEIEHSIAGEGQKGEI